MTPERMLTLVIGVILVLVVLFVLVRVAGGL